MDGLIAITYRCNAHCAMCNIWRHPSDPAEEISPSVIEKIPSRLAFINITGGEPFIREDISDFIEICRKKTRRIIISTNGYFTEKIIEFAWKNPDIGIRVSLEGFASVNNELRGLNDGFEKGLRTLTELHAMKHKDIGFGITLSDANCKDLIPLFHLSESMKMEFATAAVHNSFYFHKMDNVIRLQEEMISALELLVNELLATNRPKNWFRAFFNHGLIGYVRGQRRLLPCKAGTILFFIDPFGEVHPCNVLEESFGNLKEKSWDDIWNSEKAKMLRNYIKSCPHNCWMIGSVSPIIRQEIIPVGLWVAKNKLRSMLGKKYCATR